MKFSFICLFSNEIQFSKDILLMIKHNIKSFYCLLKVVELYSRIAEFFKLLKGIIKEFKPFKGLQLSLFDLSSKTKVKVENKFSERNIIGNLSIQAHTIHYTIIKESKSCRRTCQKKFNRAKVNTSHPNAMTPCLNISIEGVRNYKQHVHDGKISKPKSKIYYLTYQRTNQVYGTVSSKRILNPNMDRRRFYKHLVRI